MNLAYKPYTMVDKILPNGLYIISKNNMENIEKDYKYDVEVNGNPTWGKVHFHMSNEYCRNNFCNNWGGFWLLYSPWGEIQCGDAY